MISNQLCAVSVRSSHMQYHPADFFNSLASVFGACQIVKTLLILVCIYIGSIYILEGNV